MGEMDQLAWSSHESPLGRLVAVTGEDGLRTVHFPDRGGSRPPHAVRRQTPALTAQLEQYFGGERRRFDIDLDLRGSSLQLAVWELLRAIPYGETRSYGELAERVDPALFPPELEPYRRVRLVAAEIGRTPTPIVVPCHRVIGADGSLTGYGGGLHRKRALLELEGQGQLALL